MQDYDEYLKMIDDLYSVTRDNDRVHKKLLRDARAEEDRFQRECQRKEQSLQDQARGLAASYGTTVRQLKSRKASELGLVLPDRVRPVVAYDSNVEGAIKKQKQAERRFSELLETALKTLDSGGTASSVEEALVARKVLIKQKQKTPPPEIPGEEMEEKLSAEQSNKGLIYTLLVILGVILIGVFLMVLL